MSKSAARVRYEGTRPAESSVISQSSWAALRPAAELRNGQLIWLVTEKFSDEDFECEWFGVSTVSLVDGQVDAVIITLDGGSPPAFKINVRPELLFWVA